MIAVLALNDYIGSSKKMTAKEQCERFIEAARGLEFDESGKSFSAALGEILPMQKT